MARLNEAPLPTESVEALKRRFIRQNRDLVKINTQQSLRIRALEIEQSRLLSENLSLREEIIRLHNQFPDGPDEAQSSQLSSLRQRLEEMIGLVDGLGTFRRPERVRRLPDPSSWRPAIPNLRLAGLEARMPSINEDRQYPRRTLCSEEIRALRLSDQSNESPDLGPPPVAHFDYADPIKFDRPEPIVRQEPANEEDTRVIPAELSVNLETRRRRRETQAVVDMAAEEGKPATSSQATMRPARTSIKRKLGVRETEEPISFSNSEPFNFTRRGALGSENKITSASDKTDGSPTREDLTDWINADVPGERKVLGDKSVNQSPRKILVAKKSLSNLDKEPVELIKPRPRRAKTTSTLPVPVPTQSDATSDVAQPTRLPPKTPSVDIFSPSSEPSSIAMEPPSAAASANLEGMTRPSRRARAAVSYAEPSLNTKMRRPTKELVDAIYPAKAGRTSDAKRESSGAVKQDAETADKSAWTTSPVPNQQTTEQPSPLLGKTENRIASPPAMSGLLRLERPKSVTSVRSPGLRTDELAKKVGSLRVGGREDALLPRRASSVEIRKSRRHSSVSTLDEVLGLPESSSPRLGSSLETSPDAVWTEDDRPALTTRSASQPIGARSERLANRRRSMLV